MESGRWVAWDRASDAETAIRNGRARMNRRMSEIGEGLYMFGGCVWGGKGPNS